MSREYDVFLSYCSRDRAWVETLALSLERTHGLRVFWDQWDLRYGDSISSALSEVIRRVPRFLVVLTPASVASRWVTLEVDVAVHRDPDGRDGLVIPLLREDCAIPARLERLRHLDLRRDEAFDAQVAALAHLVRTGELPRGAPGRLDEIRAVAPQVDRETHPNVWFTPRRYRWFHVWREPALGTLVVRGDHVEFQGATETRRIAGVTRVAHTKMAGDINNNWVEVVHRDGDGVERTAYFANAKALGVGNLVGGSEALLRSMQAFWKRGG